MVKRIVADRCWGAIIDVQELFISQTDKRLWSKIKRNINNFARLLGHFSIPIVFTIERPVHLPFQLLVAGNGLPALCYAPLGCLDASVAYGGQRRGARLVPRGQNRARHSPSPTGVNALLAHAASIPHRFCAPYNSLPRSQQLWRVPHDRLPSMLEYRERLGDFGNRLFRAFSIENDNVSRAADGKSIIGKIEQPR